MQNLQEQATVLKSEMEKVTNEIVVAVQNGKTLKVKHLSVKLTEIASELNKVEKEIKESEIVIETIVDGEYTITIRDSKFLTLSNNDNSLKLKYTHLDNNVTPLGDIYSGFTRSNGSVFNKDIQVKFNHWTALRGKLPKEISMAIEAAEQTLVRHVSLFGGKHQTS